MKSIYNLTITVLVLFTLVALTGCGSENQGKGNGPSSDTVPGGYFAKFKEGNTTIAYIIDFYRGYATAFLKTGQLYVTVDPDTGAYLELPDSRDGRIYFPESDCSGTGIMEGFEGQVGKTVVALTNGEFYIASARSDYRGSAFSHGSYLDYEGVCRVSSSTIYFDFTTVDLSLTNRPFNFVAVESLRIEYK